MERRNGILKKENKQPILIPKASALQHVLFLIYYLLFLCILSRPVGIIHYSLYHKITTRMDRKIVLLAFPKKRLKKTVTELGGGVLWFWFLIVWFLCGWFCFVLFVWGFCGFLCFLCFFKIAVSTLK